MLQSSLTFTIVVLYSVTKIQCEKLSLSTLYIPKKETFTPPLTRSSPTAESLTLAVYDVVTRVKSVMKHKKEMKLSRCK